MRTLEIKRAGFCTSLQDLGRCGFNDWGVSPGGAADSVALRIGNLLLGNSQDSAALEITADGPHLFFENPAIVAVTGAQIKGSLEGILIPMYETFEVFPGQTLKLERVENGLRSYLCIRGGFSEKPWLHSQSQNLTSHLGPLNGNPLRVGDCLFFEDTIPLPRHRRVNQIPLRKSFGPQTLRIVESLHSELFTQSQRQEITQAEFQVSPKSDRLGIQLTYDTSKFSLAPKDEIMTTGVGNGFIQVSPSGTPTILFVEQQITGGYPVIASVISTDFWILAQLRPGDRLRFKEVSLTEAHEACLKLESWISSPHLFSEIGSI